MKVNVVHWQLLLVVFIVILLRHQLNAITNEEMEQANLALSSARHTAKVLESITKFADWLPEVGAALKSVLSVATFVIDVIFSFLDIESPEMVYMKSSFKQLNNRLDSMSVQFQDVRRKLDWSTIQIGYDKFEMTIHSMSFKRTAIVNSKTESSKNFNIQQFLINYENDFEGIPENLYLAMSTRTVLSDNLFEAVQKYTNQHPEQSFQFMKGCVKLLLQAYSISATYIHLKYNNSAADQYIKQLSTNQIQIVQKKARQVYYAMVNGFHAQLQKDLVNMALSNLNMNNQQFADLFYKYITGKYVNRYWFVVIYNPIITYEKHAVSVCDGSIKFRTGNKNLVVASVPKSRITSWTIAKGNEVLNSFGEFNQYNDAAKGVLQRVLARNHGCDPFAAIVVLTDQTSYAVRSEPSRRTKAKKSAYWCNDPACWGWGRRYYDTFVFG